MEEIVSPIKFMQDRLKEGEEINGVYAHNLSIDPAYLKDLAKKALNKFEAP